MTREEEIINEATGRYPNDNDCFLAFIKGAKYADKTMIDRACEWLGNELKETDDRDGYPTVESLYFVSVKEFIMEFRQSMKGCAE